MSVKEPVSLQDLINGGAIFNVDLDDVRASDEEDVEEENNCKDALASFANLNCVGDFDLQHEDTYIEGQPFEIIASKMENLLEDGKIKKRVIRKGYGKKPEDLDIVKVHYNFYIEYEADPFDSTYVRKRPHQFSVNNGEVIVGLDIAVQSMHLNEKSQFMVEPELAYGKLGCLNRIPANSVVLLEVELVDIIDAAAATSFKHLPEQKQKDFCEVVKYCEALCAKAKDLVGKNINAAIKEYNTAVTKMENADLKDYSEQEKHEQFLLKLYSNLLICYTNIEEPRKGCINFNKINNMAINSNIKISAKVYYNNAKCLRMLGDYELAKKRLSKAHYLEPRNSDIAKEFLYLEDKIKEYRKKEAVFAKALLGSDKSK